MNDIKKKINDINIPFEYNPSSEDYVRGHCLYKLEGYIQPKYVIYNEELSAFNKSSNIYKYGINILQKFNLDINEWTLVYNVNPEWCNYFTLKENI